MSTKTDLGIPGFDLIATLDGGRNPVYRARSLISGDEVAIKIFDRLSEPVLPRFFDRRARLIGSLSRREIGFAPCIVSGELTGQPYLVSPFYVDGSLDDLMSHGPMPWARAVRLINRTCAIVAEAHDADLILGDLRPTAVLLSGFDTPMVAAFGMAAVRFDDGAPTYEAPERIDRMPLSPAADVYSLSAMLAALMLSRPRERTESLVDYLKPLRGSVPQTVLRVIENGLTARPGNRYGNARLLGRALDAATSSSGSSTAALDHAVGLGPASVPTGASAPNSQTGRPRRPAAHADRDGAAANSLAGDANGSTQNGAGPPTLTDLVFALGDDRPDRSDATDESADGDDLSELLADIGLADEAGPENITPAVDSPPPPPRPGDAVRLDQPTPTDIDIDIDVHVEADSGATEFETDDGPEIDSEVGGAGLKDAEPTETAIEDTESVGSVPPPPTAADLIRLDDGGGPTSASEPTPDRGTPEVASNLEPIASADAELGPTAPAGPAGSDMAVAPVAESTPHPEPRPDESILDESIPDESILEVDLSKDVDDRIAIPIGPSTDDVETSLGFDTSEFDRPPGSDETGEIDLRDEDDRTGEIDLRDEDDWTDDQTAGGSSIDDAGGNGQSLPDEPTWPAPAGEKTGRPLQDSWGSAEPDDSVLLAATNTMDLYVGHFADDPSDRSGSDESTRPWVAPAAAFAGATDDDAYGTLEIESLADLDEPETDFPLAGPPSARADLKEQPTIDFASPLAQPGAETEVNGVDPEKTLDPGSLPPSVAAMAATTIDLTKMDVLYGEQSIADDLSTVEPRAERGADSTLPLELTTLDDVGLPLVDADGNGDATRTGEFEPADLDNRAGAAGNGDAPYDFADDPTHIFPDDDAEPEHIEERSRRPEPVPAGPPFGYPSAGTGEEIPFTAPSVRYGVQHVGRWRRIATRMELAWFNSRRRLYNVAAIIGVFLIAAVAVYFGASEFRRTSIRTDEGVPLAPTSTTEPRASRNAPIVTDLPDTNPTTTTRPPRRVTTTTAAPTSPPTTEAPTTTRPPATEAPTTTRRGRPTTTEAPTTTRRPPTTAEPTTTRRGRPTTTEAPTTTRRPPTTAEPTTTAAPPTTEEPDDDDDLPFAAPPTIDSPDISVSANSATIAYRSDQCVATRFLLTGEDGVRRRGSSPGFDPDVACSTAWNLDFSADNGLQPDTGYSLSIWVRAKDTGSTSNARFTFRTSP